MLNLSQQTQLLTVAKQSVKSGINEGHACMPDLNNQPDVFLADAASFVTLNIQHNLRGCIGSLIATRPLIIDIAENAFAAAFRDPRFPPVTEHEFSSLSFHLSILAPPQPLMVNSEQELMEKLRPSVDGLIISDAGRQATFLPSVWKQLPDKKQFLAHLKQKAGFPANYWSNTMKVEYYTVEEFGDKED